MISSELASSFLTVHNSVGAWC